jgi:hypothetical protein
MAELAEIVLAERQYGYILNLPDIFTVHTDTDDVTLIIYSIK